MKVAPTYPYGRRHIVPDPSGNGWMWTYVRPAKLGDHRAPPPQESLLNAQPMWMTPHLITDTTEQFHQVPGWRSLSDSLLSMVPKDGSVEAFVHAVRSAVDTFPADKHAYLNASLVEEASQLTHEGLPDLLFQALDNALRRTPTDRRLAGRAAGSSRIVICPPGYVRILLPPGRVATRSQNIARIAEEVLITGHLFSEKRPGILQWSLRVVESLLADVNVRSRRAVTDGIVAELLAHIHRRGRVPHTGPVAGRELAKAAVSLIPVISSLAEG